MTRAGRFKRSARFMLSAVAALAATPALATPASAENSAATSTDRSIDRFYAAQGGRPVWFGSSLADQSAARALIALLRTAEADGLDPKSYPIDRLEQALSKLAAGSFDNVVAADRLFSETLVRYARDTRRTSTGQMIWVDSRLRPSPPTPSRLLESLAASASPQQFIAGMGWMNPIYAGLRQALQSGEHGQKHEYLLRLNLERARVLPDPDRRYVLVNASAARLTMFDGPLMVGSMRVVVGKPAQATPMMAALIQYTSLNPYWNVPPDLTAERIAPNVLKTGLSYLEDKGYQVLSTWDENAQVVDPGTVDWEAVAAGQAEIRVRQLPGPDNAMGQMKFMFPNSQGVYLHDTPQKELLAEASRMFSGGCVRLEDAPRLARWLHGRSLEPNGAMPEQHVALKEPVPVYITYLTAVPDEGKIAFYPDVYGRDEQALAAAGKSGTLASRQ